ncbi:hypothetical protein G5714_019434 [Onychostoma macrolepis]|uniref:Uncharacterized protein n=1 Tax=Onychostoma macrolepis TaxID=369639 RepID=A0A7J6BWF8_9TELE|nr:hypothetical protein G5714_019434 [Onychostoma macrolepis]
MTIVLVARNRQGGVVNTHSGASRLSEWLVFGAECSFPLPRDSIRNAVLIPEPVACRLCQGGASGPSSPGGTSATAVLVSPPAHARAEQHSSPWTMATRSLRVRRLISPQWGQSDPPSAASAWARPRQKTHDSWPSEGSIGSTQERQSREVIFIRPKLTGTQQGKKRRVRCRV